MPAHLSSRAGTPKVEHVPYCRQGVPSRGWGVLRIQPFECDADDGRMDPYTPPVRSAGLLLAAASLALFLGLGWLILAIAQDFGGLDSLSEIVLISAVLAVPLVGVGLGIA